MNRQTVPLAAVLLLAGLTVAWGACWPAMKFAVGEFPVLTFRFLTAFGGGVFMLALSALQGSPIALPRREWGITAFAALFNVTGWFYLTGLGLTLLPASRASVIAYTMPLFAILSAVIFNALIIIALIPLALRGVRYAPATAASLLRRNLLVFGLGGLAVPFLGIKAIDLVVNAIGIV